MKTLAERLIAERESRGISQPELAAKAKISQSFIGALETGRQKSSGWLPEIAYALGLQAMWLKTGIGPKEINPRLNTLASPPHNAINSPPGENYTDNVVIMQTPAAPLIKELNAIASRMSERGLQVLIYEAEKIDKSYPQTKANPAS